jgi:predicted N-acetyltransferase YhbS
MRLDHLRTRQDLEQAAGLVADSFASRHADLQRVFRHDFNIDSGVRPEHIRVVRSGGKVVSLIVIYEKPIRIGRAKMKMGGLGFVCSNPRYRGKGLASKCLSDAVTYMKKNGFHLSTLFGIDRFYGRAGYVGCLPNYRMKVPVGVLEKATDSLVIQSVRLQDFDEMLRLYHAASVGCPVSVLRTRQSLKESLLRRRMLHPSSKGQASVQLFRERSGRRAVRGYVVWRDGNLWEAAVAPGDEVAASCILAWLRDRRKEALEKEVVLPHGPQHPLTQYALRFNHSFERSFSWTGGGMGRVIDISGFLEALQPELEARVNSAGMDGQCHVHLAVSDAHPGGVAVRKSVVVRHTLRLGGGHQFMLAHRPHYWLRVECSAQSLLQLALGCLPLATLPCLKVEGERNLLPVLFPESAPEIFTLDHF